VRLLEPKFAAARSARPSELRSPKATEKGRDPAGCVELWKLRAEAELAHSDSARRAAASARTARVLLLHGLRDVGFAGVEPMREA
jgi:hypothetical protein